MNMKNFNICLSILFTIGLTACGGGSGSDSDTGSRIISMSFSDGGETTLTYDSTNRLSKDISTSASGTRTTVYTYNDKNQQITKVVTGSDFTTTTYTYNTSGLIDTETTTNTDNGKVLSTTTYTYNSNNQLATSILTATNLTATSTTTYSDYNNAGLPTISTKISETGSSQIDSYTYNASNQLTLHTSSDGLVHYSYDKEGRLISLTAPSDDTVTFIYESKPCAHSDLIPGSLIHTQLNNAICKQ